MLPRERQASPGVPPELEGTNETERRGDGVIDGGSHVRIRYGHGRFQRPDGEGGSRTAVVVVGFFVGRRKLVRFVRLVVRQRLKRRGAKQTFEFFDGLWPNSVRE